MVSVATDDRRPLALQWPCTRMMLMTAAGFTGFFVTLPSLPAYLVSAGNSTASAGATTTVMLAATVMFQPVVPALLRRLSTPATMAIGLLVLGLPAPLLIWASSGAGLYLDMRACAAWGLPSSRSRGRLWPARSRRPAARARRQGCTGWQRGFPT